MKHIESKFGHGYPTGAFKEVSPEVISSTLTFLRDSRQPKLTDQQLESLMTVKAILLIAPNDLPYFEPDTGVGKNSSSLWLTQRIIADPSDPLKAVEDYKERDALRSAKLERLQKVFDERYPHEQLCDYSEECIQKLAETKESNWDLYRELDGLISAGAMEREINEIMRFAPSITDTFFPLVASVIKGLHEYVHLSEVKDCTLESRIVSDQCEALVIVGVAMKKIRKHGLMTENDTIADDGIVNWLVQNPSLAGKAASVISDRKDATLEILKTSCGDAMGDGYL